VATAIGLPAEVVSLVLEADAVAAPEPAGPTTFAEVEPTTPTAPRGGVLRVEVGRVDDAIEKLSTLIVTRWRLERAALALATAGADVRELRLILTENARQLRELRASLLRVRMVPAATMLEPLALVVRGLGKASHKQVALTLEGGGAELDKTVAERIFPALVHLVRNAVDHGLERPEDRVRAGKAEVGSLRISCSTKNRRIEVRVEDDGRGIDRVAVARAANAPVPADDSALLELMCRTGLSTRASADTTSGRGVGLDVVKRTVVDGLGGDLEVETGVGPGAAFVLRVPLTIAIVDAFVASCGGARYVVPVPGVEEIVEVAGARNFVVRRGETIPLVDLGRALGAGAKTSEAVQAFLVRRTREDAVAFAIDRVLGQQEAVVRPLADPLVAVPGVSGSTDLGDGLPTLVLDLHGLAARLDAEAAA
jgi:two-component system chemotaxis sensor kinase CheA